MRILFEVRISVKDGANSSKGSQGDSGLVRISEEVVVRLFRECEFISACECDFLGWNYAKDDEDVQRPTSGAPH